MRRAATAFGVVLVGALIGVAGLGLARGSTLAYSLGVSPAVVAATLTPGDRACQAPIRPPTGTDFDRVGIVLATFGRPGPEMAVEVLDDSTGRRLARGSLPAGYPDLDHELREQVVSVGRVDTTAPLRVCIVNEGSRRAAVVGQAGIASPSTTATLNRQPLETDLTVNLRMDRQSLLAHLPDIADRAARFRAGWVGWPLYLALGLLVVVGAPLTLARGLQRAEDENRRADQDLGSSGGPPSD
jgi:hypothetical protein